MSSDLAARPVLFDDWLAALCELTAHQQACPPCLTYEPSTRCRLGALLFASEQGAWHAHFQARFGPGEVQTS